jgi:hypothetical protein
MSLGWAAIFAPPFLLDNSPANLKIGVDLHQVHTARHRGAGSGNQFADAFKKRGLRLHNSPRMVCSTLPIVVE